MKEKERRAHDRGAVATPCRTAFDGRLAAGCLGGLLLALAALAADAAPICRWVDDSGRTHLADVVPERYLHSAQCRDSSQYRISPDRVEQARQQANELKQRADLGDGNPTGRPDPAAAPAGALSAPSAALSAPSSGASARQPARGVDSSTDCSTWRELYRQSGECFAPYRVVGGGVKAEAFEKCRPIPSPDLQCGPARSN